MPGDRCLVSHPRLSIIPAGAIFDRSLEPRDLHVLNLLGCHTDKAGWCRRSQVKMASQLGCGRASVQRSLDRLVEAGWVEKKRPPWSSEVGQPSASYMYRVVLDRDESVIAEADDDEDEAASHAETASDEGGCPPVGTLDGEGGAHPDGHPGAQPCVGTRAHTCVGTKNDPLERPLVEREREARARDRTKKFLNDFEARWPTSAADDRQRTAYAAAALTEEEQAACLAGIAPFLDYLARVKRKTIPAGWRYIEEKRWTLLEQPEAKAATAPISHPVDSPAGKAIIALYDVAGLSTLCKATRLRHNAVYQQMLITPRLLAFADLPPRSDWVTLTRQQAAAWDAMLREAFPNVPTRVPLREGASAPWPWPPGADGRIYTAAGPAQPEMAEHDATDFR